MKGLPSTLAVAVALCMSLIIFGSCGDNETGPEKDALTRNSPQNLLKIYAKALEDKSLADYEACLEDDYRFVFLQQDYTAAGVDPMAPYWGRTLDLDATSAMFTNSHVFGITCDLPILTDIAPSDTLRHLVTGIGLKVTVDRGEPELTTFWVKQTFLHFTLAMDRYQPSLWVIRGIEEEVEDLLETPGWQVPFKEEQTYGNLKSMFRK